jgi:3-oxoacyl-[acyl-carrier protein] reductase
MDLDLKGRRALITGSSSGLGEAIAKMLAREGADVIVHGRDCSRVEAVANTISGAGGRADQALGDLTTDAGADAVCEQALARGPVDILVNNAGYYGSRGWSDTSEDEWLNAYNANVVSGVRMIKRLVPAMRERGWGRVIQISGGLHYSLCPASRNTMPRSQHVITSRFRSLVT